MSDNQAPKNVNVTTEKGIAKYPKLDKPDTKFRAEGEYQVRLILSAEAAQPIIDKLNGVADKMEEFTRADLTSKIAAEKNGEKKGKLKKALADLKRADLPVRPVFDEDGNETGDVELNFKMKAQRTDKKTGKVIKMAPNFFDAGGKKMAPTAVWGGSEMKVAGQVVPFYTAAVGVGASLRLSAVQIIKLVAGGQGDAESYGFGKEEGYEADDSGFGDDNDSDTDGSGSTGDDTDF